MKKLFKNEDVCILSEKYFVEVMQIASLSIRSFFPYDKEYAKEAWYRNIFFRKFRGYIITGFKMNWKIKPLEKTKQFLPAGSTYKEPDLIKIMENTPIESIFIPEELYKKIKSLRGKAFVVTLTHYGTVKTKNKFYGIFPYFCLIASDLTEVLNEDEIEKVESVKSMLNIGAMLKN